MSLSLIQSYDSSDGESDCEQEVKIKPAQTLEKSVQNIKLPSAAELFQTSGSVSSFSLGTRNDDSVKTKTNFATTLPRKIKRRWLVYQVSLCHLN